MTFTTSELLDILISLGDLLRREEDSRPNEVWIEDIKALRRKVREELKKRHSGHVE